MMCAEIRIIYVYCNGEKMWTLSATNEMNGYLEVTESYDNRIISR